MATRPIPCLGPDGYITETAKKADLMLAHFFAAEYSQTHFYQKQVSSLPWIIREKQGDMNSTARVVKETLENYFGRYFNNVEVEVNHKAENDTSRVALTIWVSFVDDEGKSFSLAKVAQTLDSKVVKILDLNNYGVEPT